MDVGFSLNKPKLALVPIFYLRPTKSWAEIRRITV
jgi:hypothetical protein